MTLKCTNNLPWLRLCLLAILFNLAFGESSADTTSSTTLSQSYFNGNESDFHNMVKTAFNQFDTNGDGLWDATEIRTLFNSSIFSFKQNLAMPWNQTMKSGSLLDKTIQWSVGGISQTVLNFIASPVAHSKIRLSKEIVLDHAQSLLAYSFKTNDTMCGLAVDRLAMCRSSAESDAQIAIENFESTVQALCLHGLGPLTLYRMEKCLIDATDCQAVNECFQPAHLLRVVMSSVDRLASWLMQSGKSGQSQSPNGNQQVWTAWSSWYDKDDQQLQRDLILVTDRAERLHANQQLQWTDLVQGDAETVAAVLEPLSQRSQQIWSYLLSNTQFQASRSKICLSNQKEMKHNMTEPSEESRQLQQQLHACLIRLAKEPLPVDRAFCSQAYSPLLQDQEPEKNPEHSVQPAAIIHAWESCLRGDSLLSNMTQEQCLIRLNHTSPDACFQKNMTAKPLPLSGRHGMVELQKRNPFLLAPILWLTTGILSLIAVAILSIPYWFIPAAIASSKRSANTYNSSLLLIPADSQGACTRQEWVWSQCGVIGSRQSQACPPGSTLWNLKSCQSYWRFNQAGRVCSKKDVQAQRALGMGSGMSELNGLEMLFRALLGGSIYQCQSLCLRCVS